MSTIEDGIRDDEDTAQPQVAQVEATQPEVELGVRIAELDERIAQASELMKSTADGVESAKALHAKTVATVDQLVVERDSLVAKAPRNKDIVAYLESQKKLREDKARELQQLRDVGLGAYISNGKSRLDQAMARKNGRGTVRPSIPLMVPPPAVAAKG